MKKALLLGLALLGTIGLTGCDMIANLISGETSYNYNDFRALLADRKLSFDATKCSSTVKTDDKTEKREYTYDAENKVWKYTYQEDLLGTGVLVELTSEKTLDIVSDVKTCELAAALVDKTVDDIFKFYATSNSYRITGEYSTSSEHNTVEYKYRSDGLVTYKYNKQTNLTDIKTTEKTETLSYSK